MNSKEYRDLRNRLTKEQKRLEKKLDSIKKQSEKYLLGSQASYLIGKLAGIRRAKKLLLKFWKDYKEIKNKKYKELYGG